MSNEADLYDVADTRLRQAADDLFDNLPTAPGAFKPSPRRSGPVAVAAIVLLVAGGLWGLSQRQDMQSVEAADPDRSAANQLDDGDTGEGEGPSQPVELTEANVGTDPVPLSAMVRPSVGELAADPDFGSLLVRLTDAAPGEAIVPIVNMPSAWNADGSRLLLYRTGGETIQHELYRFDPDGSIVFDQVLPPPSSDIEQFYWSRFDPNVVFFIDGIDLVAFDVAVQSVTTLFTFNGCESVDSGVAPVPQSFDDQRWGLLCHRGDQTDLLAYDHETGELRQRVADRGIVAAPRPIDVANGFLVETSTAVELLDADLNTVRTIAGMEPTGVAMTVEVDGDEFAVGPAFNTDRPGSLVAVSLNDPDADPVVIVGPESGYPYPPSGTVVVGTGQRADPSIAVAVIGDVSDGEPTVLDGEILAVDLTSEPRVVRLAHHRASADDYFRRPNLSMSPQGRYIVFASDWGGESTDTYLLFRP